MADLQAENAYIRHMESQGYRTWDSQHAGYAIRALNEMLAPYGLTIETKKDDFRDENLLYRVIESAAKANDSESMEKPTIPSRMTLALNVHPKQFVLLRGILHGNEFFSNNTPGRDPTLSGNGEKWYEIIGYADTVEEAQRKLGY